jgi:hypothetical protein
MNKPFSLSQEKVNRLTPLHQRLERLLSEINKLLRQETGFMHLPRTLKNIEDKNKLTLSRLEKESEMKQVLTQMQEIERDSNLQSDSVSEIPESEFLSRRSSIESEISDYFSRRSSARSESDFPEFFPRRSSAGSSYNEGMSSTSPSSQWEHWSEVNSPRNPENLENGFGKRKRGSNPRIKLRSNTKKSKRSKRSKKSNQSKQSKQTKKTTKRTSKTSKRSKHSTKK